MLARSQKGQRLLAGTSRIMGQVGVPMAVEKEERGRNLKSFTRRDI